MKRRKPAPRQRPLTAKQQRFIEAYIRCKGNGTAAAMEAYDCANRSTAHSIASENLRKPAIAAEIELRLSDGLMDYLVKTLEEMLQSDDFDQVFFAMDRVVDLWELGTLSLPRDRF